MALSREEIEQIAKASAQTVLEGLHRYAVEYEEPKTIEQGLQDSMVEESTAVAWYRKRATHAASLHDTKTSALYYHIADEEADHIVKFKDRLQKLSKELTPANIALLAITEDNPVRKFCCRQCGECVPEELLEEGRFPERITWLREHYKQKHPGMWGQ